MKGPQWAIRKTKTFNQGDRIMTNTKKAKWIGCLAAVAVFAVAGTATANAKDHHRHHDDGNTAVQIIRAIVDLLDGPDVIVANNPAPVVIHTPAPAPRPVVITTPAPAPRPVVVHRPAPPRPAVHKPAPPRRDVKPAPPKHDKGKAPAPKHDNKKGGKGGRR